MGLESLEGHLRPLQKTESMRTRILFCLFFLLLTAPLWAQSNYRVLNASTPGQRFELEDYLPRGKQNLVVFISSNSPVCERFLEKVRIVAQRNPELQVALLSIDRPEREGIDWRSPLSRQFRLQALPHVMLYDGVNLESQGYAVRKWLLEQWSNRENSSR